MYPTLPTLIILYLVLAAHACPRGSFRAPGSSECTRCPPGTYQHMMNATSCIPCSGGTYLSYYGGQAPNACQNCPIGTFSSAGSSSCTRCRRGTFSNFGSDKCVRCPKGTIISAYPTSQTPREYCEKCYSGYTDKVNLLECLPCPRGSSAPPGSSSIKQCKRCPAGTVSDGRNECSPCYAGTMPNSDSSGCISCPLGFKFEQLSGVAKCVPCQPGEYAKVGQSFFGIHTPEGCQQCPENTTTYGLAARFCRRLNGPCPKGYLQTPAGDCVRCNTDERYDVKLQHCVPCPPNQGSVGGLPLKCAPCTDVVKARIATSKCALGVSMRVRLKFADENRKCSPGYRIKDTRLGRFCEACKEGTFSAQPNSRVCRPCPRGTIAAEFGSEKCEKCPTGTIPHRYRDRCFNPITGCRPGEYLNVDAAGYTLCVREGCSISEEAGLICPPCTGSYQDTYSFAGCGPCPGKQVRNLDFTCGCSGPFAQNRGIIDGSCSECPAGSYGKWIGTGNENTCVQCPAGTYRDAKTVEELMATCPRCGNATPCLKCPAGFITRHDGATRCEKCPQGTFTYGIGDTECLRFGAPSAPVRFNDALDVNVVRERERLAEWL